MSLQLTDGPAIGVTASVCGHSKDFVTSLPASSRIFPSCHLHCLEKGSKVWARCHCSLEAFLVASHGLLNRVSLLSLAVKAILNSNSSSAFLFYYVLSIVKCLNQRLNSREILCAEVHSPCSPCFSPRSRCQLSIPTCSASSAPGGSVQQHCVRCLDGIVDLCCLCSLPLCFPQTPLWLPHTACSSITKLHVSPNTRTLGAEINPVHFYSPSNASQRALVISPFSSLFFHFHVYVVCKCMYECLHVCSHRHWGACVCGGLKLMSAAVLKCYKELCSS